jgi:type II secretory pathway pseudopilin PulG
MAALLVAIAVMAVAMTVALPAWRQQTQREREEELIFRGRQYVRAVQLFQRKQAAAYPPDVDFLVRQKFLRQKYPDPMVKDGEFEILYQGSAITISGGAATNSPPQGRGGVQTPSSPGARVSLTFDSMSGTVVQGGRITTGGVVGPRGGVVGVRSKSTEASIRVYNGATHYNEWLFMFLARATGPGQRGGQGGPGGGGRGGQGMGPGGDFQGGPGGMGQRGGGQGGMGQRGGGQGGPGRGGQGGGPGRGGTGGAQPQPQRGGRGQIS